MIFLLPILFLFHNVRKNVANKTQERCNGGSPADANGAYDFSGKGI